MRTLLPPYLLCFLFLFSNTLSAATRPTIATVIKIRGTVTKLLPGTLEASRVEIDDKFPEDTSVVTGPKSFVRIKFADKSELNMGPESKIVISEMGTESVGIISLLKGRIRTEVQKTHNPDSVEKNKFYIRTRTAALGVRGTDFQTIYNPDNRMTSLLTYRGSVAMVKIDEKTHQRIEGSNTEIVRSSVTSTPELKSIPGKALGEQEELAIALNSSSAVMVLPGQTSFASDALVKSSLPVNISPLQLNALYKNSDFNEKNILNLKSGIEAKSLKLDLATVRQETPTEGFYNAKNGDFAPKAGGFIDLNTALYVAPDRNASLDDKTGVYIAENSGNFDADTGDYFAPKGLILDAKKGFVIDKNADVKPELLAQREDMNTAIARDRVVGDLDGEVILAAKTLREKFIRDRLTFSVMVGPQDLKIKNYSDVKDDSALKLNILWQIASANRFAPLLGLTYAKASYNSLQSRGDSQDSRSLFTIATGLKYALTNRIDLKSLLTLEQGHYAAQTGSFPDVYAYKRIVVTKLNLGMDIEILRSNNFSLMGDILGNIGFRKRYNKIVVSDISGLNLKLIPQYAISERKKIGLGLYLKKEKSHVSSSISNYEENRDEHGFELRYTVDL